ncbi:MAG: DUF3857 domain-containing protein [Candidatus Aminicenantes bacterium]|nr:DUF3857 domain-containing protein [Candidatus Aminicenantes bacterium]
MKRLAIISLVFLSAGFLFSLPVGAAPAHDARFLSLKITYHLNLDGSWDREYHHRVRLDTYYAVNRALGETFILYNPDFQKLEILKSETTMADGRKVATPENAFNEVLPFAAHGFADFSGLREMVVTHTGLERGAVVELHYRLHTKAGFLPAFSAREGLSRDFPIERYLLTVTAPGSCELKYALFNLDALVSVTPHAGGDTSYVVSLQNLKPAVHEPLAQPQAEPFVIFSAASGWGQAMALEGDSSPLPPAWIERIEKLKARHPARSDLVSALQRSVAVEVQNCELGPEATGWQPRPLERVAASNYGTRLEKALLLQALLQKAGIDADVLAVAGDACETQIPLPLPGGDFWLKVPAEAAYLDPWHEQQELFPYAYHGRNAWNLERQEMEKLPETHWENNGIDVSGTVKLDAGAASGDLIVVARGSFNRYEEAAADGGKFVAGLLRRVFPVDKVEVKKLLALTRRELRAEVSFSGKWLQEAGGSPEGPRRRAFLLMESCRLPGLSENMIIQGNRESPLALEAPFNVSVRLDIEAASELRLEYAAPAVEKRNELGYYSRSLAAVKDGTLRLSASAGIEKGIVAPNQYPRLRELLLSEFEPGPWLIFRNKE